MYFLPKLQICPSSINTKGWWNSEPAYISSLISQTNLMGKVFILSLRTLSNLSLCATVMVFFQSPTVPEERGSKGRWEAEHAPLQSPLQTVSVSLGKQFLASLAFPCHWPAERGSVSFFEGVLPNLSAVNKTQRRPIILTPHKVIQLICSGVLLIYLRSKRKLLRATPLIFLSMYHSNSWRSPPTLGIRTS